MAKEGEDGWMMLIAGAPACRFSCSVPRLSPHIADPQEPWPGRRVSDERPMNAVCMVALVPLNTWLVLVALVATSATTASTASTATSATTASTATSATTASTAT
eukprot:11198423-Lingulodinium_polyedra.AAC.2